MSEIIKDQKSTSVYSTHGGWIAIEQESWEFGKRVSILICPEHVESLCEALKNCSNELTSEQ